jgi:poly-beta-1,6-N-acetyl-D-glucosamine N-deacetylase
VLFAIFHLKPTAMPSLADRSSRLIARVGRSRLAPTLRRWGVNRSSLKRGVTIAGGLALALAIGIGVIEAQVDRVAVLGFHDIIDPNLPSERAPARDPVESDYTRQDFERVLTYLVDQNYWFLTAEELYDYFAKPNPDPIPEEFKHRPRVAISIDDGYASAHAHVLKAAEKVQKRTGKTVKFIWFINPAFLGRTDTELPRMTCEDLQAGFEAGFYDVQSHTANHQDLTTLEPEAIEIEFKQARDQLVACIGDLDRQHQVARHVAYPFGKTNSTVIKYARRYHLSGYVYDSHLLRVLPWHDRYRLSRLPVNGSMPVEKLKKWASRGSL